ncbi:MAG: hypothetical protein L6Q98_05970 [Anaerolineae bacterium]|nr:hypothetical protein [Anaerolineae bacterium]NUQ05710.1 hypothetical protein [Anaerolineae bacterium]
MNPYFVVTFLFVALAALGALDASFIHLDWLPLHAGLRWMRVHFITLGAVTEFAFGVLPLLVAVRLGAPRPRLRWDIWLMLNLGLLALLVGIPLANGAFITVGGTLIFTAAVLLMVQMWRMLSGRVAAARSEGLKFYLMGLAYLLLGILVGTGLWQGWSDWLRIQTPLEVHIHANNWGFMSLIFAGLLADLYPSIAGRPLASPPVMRSIFWLMSLGALGLVLGPWFKSNLFAVPGLVLHMVATMRLLFNVIRRREGDPAPQMPGILHIVTAYAWILAPVLIAPLIILEVPGVPGPAIEQNAPQALIYGWVLQFSYALIPLLFRRLFLPDSPPRLGGNWFSLLTVHAGALFLWAGIFAGDSLPTLHGIAYALWAASLLPIAYDLWKIVRAGLNRLPQEEFSLAG